MILTTLAVACSIFLVCAVRMLPAVRDSMLAEAAGSLRLVVQHKSGPSYFVPMAYVQRIRALPHVVEVNPWSWFGGVYRDPKDQFPNYAVDPETIQEIWPDYDWDPGLLEAFKRTRNGALVGRRTMDKFGWQPGDEITLDDSGFGLRPTFKILGSIPAETNVVFATTLLFPRKYLEEALAQFGGWPFSTFLVLRIDQPEHVNTVIASIDDLFRNSEAQTKTQTEHATTMDILGWFDSLIQVISLVGWLVVAAIVLIAANTAAMSVRERIGEMAVLKTLGFPRRTIFGLLLGEGLIIAVLGGTLGAGLAYVVLNSGHSSFSAFLGPLGSFAMPVSVVIQGLCLAVVIGLVAGVLPARRAARVNIAETLRQIV